MSSPKRPKRVRFDDATAHTRVKPSDFSSATSGGAPRPVSFAAANGRARMSRTEAWNRLGPRVWDLLKTKRISELLPGDHLPEFDRIMELRRRWGGPHAREIFIGFRHPGAAPLFVPREVFQRHGYVLGGSGSGKTSHALAQLLLQLAEPHDWDEDAGTQPTPILILDMKPGGDPFLRALAEQVADREGRKFRFFSTDPKMESMQFDPFMMMRATPYRVERAETLIKAFSLIYTEGYGSDFFTAEQRTLLIEIIHNEDPNTFQELIDVVRSETTGASGNKDARGLYSAIGNMRYALHVNVNSDPVPPDQQLDFERFLDEAEILYVHLDSRGNFLLSRDIGKLILFSLLKTATERLKRRVTRQAFVLIDEFQRLAARNVVEMLEDARSAGVGFVLAHQSSSALETRDGDLYGTLFENCSFKQFLTMEDPRVFKLLQLISGRTTERTFGGSKGSSSTGGSSWSSGSGVSHTFASGDPAAAMGPTGSTISSGAASGHGTTISSSSGTGGSGSHTTFESTTWTDNIVPGLREDVIAELHRTNLLSLVHVKRGDDGLTPTHAIPLLVQGIHPVDKTTYKEMSRRPWPTQSLTDDDYLQRARPKVGSERVAAAGSAPSKPTLRPPGKRPGASPELRNELQQRLTPLYERVKHDMPPCFVDVRELVKRWNITLAALATLADAAAIAFDAKDPWLRADHAQTLENLLRSAERRKDNGPP